MSIYEDTRALQTRIGVLQALTLALMALLLAYFWYLQVLRGRYYRELAENNRIRTIAIAAPRGTLLDRHGRLLVENRPSFNVLLHPEDAENLDGTLGRLGQLLRTGRFLDRHLQRLQLGLQIFLTGKRGFHFTEGGQHGVAIIRDSFPQAGIRAVDVGPQPAALEQGSGDVPQKAPHVE